MAFATLTLDLIARLANIEADMGRMAQLAEKGAQRVDRAFSAIGATVGGLGIGLGVAAITNGIRNIVDQADGMNDLASRTQTSVQAIASFKLIAEQSGTSLESLGKGINRVTLFMGQNAAEAKALGITARDPVEGFLQFADALDNAATPQERAALASKVLGKSYEELLPLLNEGSGKLRQSAQASAAYAEAMAKLAPEADKFKDQLAELDQHVDVLAIRFGNRLVPGLNATAESMANLSEKGHPVMALLRGLAGLGKAPFDLVLGEIDTGVGGQINDLKSQLSTFERRREGLNGGGLLQRWLFGEKDELDRQITVTRNQIEALTKYQDRLRLPTNLTKIGSNSYRGDEGALAMIREQQAAIDELLSSGMSDEEAFRFQESLRKAFNTKPLDDFVNSFAQRAEQIKAEYAAMRAGFEAAGVENPTGSDVSGVLVKAREALNSGDAVGAKSLAEQAKTQLKTLAGNGAPGFETAYLSRELENFELAMNASAEKTAASARQAMTKQLNGLAEEVARIDPLKIPLVLPDIAADLQRQYEQIRKALEANPLTLPISFATGTDAGDLRRAALKFGAR